ncbi:MAG: hypothetical protein JW855_06160 [Gammaproteobacteria bacterium]|nr:hypothetical protein [Gammaproteobacteria bacterium]
MLNDIDPEDLKKGGYRLFIVDSPPEKTRPLLISVVCVLGFLFTALGIGVILFFPHSVEELVRLYGHHLPVWSVITNIFSLIAFIGIWRMKYWGIILYCFAYGAGAFHSHMTGYEILWAYIPGLIVIASSLLYLRRFST